MTIRNATEFLQGAGLDHGAVDCQNPGVAYTPINAPWRDADREGDKTRLYEYIRYEPSGASLRQVVRTVFDKEAATGDADYQLAKRFYNRHSEFFKTYSKGPETWVEPRLGCFTGLNLRQQYAKRKTSVRDGDGPTDAVDSGENLGAVDVEADWEGRQFAKDRVLSYLNKYLHVKSDSVRKSLLREFVTDKAGTEDRWQVFERIRGVGDDYLCLPYRTRYNDGRRAGDVRDGFEAALRSATDRHNNAVVLTTTTDPKRHSGLSEALENLSKNKGRLMSWLSTEYQMGYRPENLTVIEFTESGLPHLHIVLFGVSYDVSQEQLAAKWRDYGQGSVVDIRQAKNPHDGDTWRLHDDELGTVTLRQYLGKAIRELQTVANADAVDLQERLKNGDVSLWRQALYWATERQYYTCSPSLRKSDAVDSGLPHVTVWEFVGVCRYRDIPAHVRESATFDVEPPPGRDSITAQSTPPPTPSTAD